jgi:hypothetical protein
LPEIRPPEKIPLKPGERDKLSQEIRTKIEASRTAMQPMLKRMRDWRRYYENTLPPKMTPWENCSNINVPLILSHVDTYSPNIKGVITNVSPFTKVSTKLKDMQGKAPAVERLLQNVKTKWMKFNLRLDEVTDESLLTPAGITKTTWCEDYRTVRKEVPVIDPLTQEPAIDPETGQPAMRVQDVLVPRHKGPKLDLVDLDQFFVYPPTSPDIDSAQAIGDRYRLTRAEVEGRIKRDVFDKEQGAKILEHSTSEQAVVTDVQDDDKDDYDGIEKVHTEEYRFWDVLYGYDANGDGIPEDCLFTIHEDTGEIVRAVRYPYYHGRRYYIDWRPFRRAKRFWGRCIPQILEGCQQEINTVHNQRTDCTTISLSKPFLAKKGSGIKPDDVVIFPGAVIPVDDATDLQEMPISPVVPGLEIEQNVRDWAERADAVTDIATGRVSETEKTAREVATTTAASSIRFDSIIDRMQDSHLELDRQLLGLMAQFMSDAEINALAEVDMDEVTDVDELLTREDLTYEWDLQAHGNSRSADKVAQREEAMGVYRLLLGEQPNPLATMTPMRVHAITSDVLRVMDKGDVATDYIGTEEEAKLMFEQAQMAAQQQAQMQQEALLNGAIGGDGALAGGGAALAGGPEASPVPNRPMPGQMPG